VLWILGTLNIYNFLDGIDGYAALQAVIAGLGMTFMRLDPASEALGLALAAAAAGFLIHNWHPARIFMGDVGSTTIGFLFAAMPLYLPVQRQPRAVFAIGICLWFFLADGALTLTRRILQRERFWEPHRSHLYQQLVISGIQHDVVVIRIAAMAVPLSGLAVLAARSSQDWLLWVTALFAVLCLSAYVQWVRRQRTRTA
jgi:UDP-N-acetylmuramyl pentapeptide phosphotransferase/UDP-N-acetylglucosamine-1-phosphate transferase